VGHRFIRIARGGGFARHPRIIRACVFPNRDMKQGLIPMCNIVCSPYGDNLHDIYRANITEDGAIRNLVIDLKIERIWDVLYFKEEL
jgi:hypothetical protein